MFRRWVQDAQTLLLRVHDPEQHAATVSRVPSLEPWCWKDMRRVQSTDAMLRSQGWSLTKVWRGCSSRHVMDECGSLTSMRPWLVRSTENYTRGSWRKARLRLPLLPATCRRATLGRNEGKEKGNLPFSHAEKDSNNMWSEEIGISGGADLHVTSPPSIESVFDAETISEKQVRQNHVDTKAPPRSCNSNRHGVNSMQDAVRLTTYAAPNKRTHMQI